MIQRAFQHSIGNTFDLLLASLVILWAFRVCNNFQKKRLENNHKYRRPPVWEMIVAPIIWISIAELISVAVFYLRVQGDKADFYDWRYRFTCFFIISIPGLIGILMACVSNSKSDEN